jgi:hypothetical protein
MGKKYTDEQWRGITNAHCVDTATVLGLEFDEKRSDSKALRVKDGGGLFVFRDGKGWCCHSEDGFKNHKAPELVMKITNCNYLTALDFINDRVLGGRYEPDLYKPQYKLPVVTEEKEFSLPKRTAPNRIYAYLLNKRGIDRDIVAALINRGSLFQEADRGNCCFVGYDKLGNARYCSKRGVGDVQFRGEVANSDKRYAFAIEGNSNVLKVFESPIEVLSHATIAKMCGKDWTADTRMSLGGLSKIALKQHLEDHPGCYDEIWFCLNNDVDGKDARGLPCNHGQEYAKKLADEYSGEYKVKIKTPRYNDFNDDLIQMKIVMSDLNCTARDVVGYFYSDKPLPCRMSEDVEDAEDEAEHG